jgi:hypothetical protein
MMAAAIKNSMSTIITNRGRGSIAPGVVADTSPVLEGGVDLPT